MRITMPGVVRHGVVKGRVTHMAHVQFVSGLGSMFWQPCVSIVLHVRAWFYLMLWDEALVNVLH